MNTQEWTKQLTDAGIAVVDRAPVADGEQTAQVVAPTAPAVVPTPWYLRLLAGIGGFIGGVMLLLFFGLGLASMKLFDSVEVAFTIGALLCAGAVVVYRAASSGTAAEQCGLAVSIAGQLALVVAIVQGFKGSAMPSWWLLVAAQGVLLFFIANGLHRTLIAAAMVILGALSCRSHLTLTLWWGAVSFAATIWVWAEAHLIARGQGAAVAPPVFGALAGVILGQSPWLIQWWSRELPGADLGISQPWITGLPAVLLAVWMITPRNLAAWLLAIAVAALGMWLPAWSAALLLALLGLGSARPGWAVVAALAMIWSVWRFYYALNFSLLEKSAWMAVAGVVCIALASLVQFMGVRLIVVKEAS